MSIFSQTYLNNQSQSKNTQATKNAIAASNRLAISLANTQANKAILADKKSNIGNVIKAQSPLINALPRGGASAPTQGIFAPKVNPDYQMKKNLSDILGESTSGNNDGVLPNAIANLGNAIKQNPIAQAINEKSKAVAYGVGKGLGADALSRLVMDYLGVDQSGESNHQFYTDFVRPDNVSLQNFQPTKGDNVAAGIGNFAGQIAQAAILSPLADVSAGAALSKAAPLVQKLATSGLLGGAQSGISSYGNHETAAQTAKGMAENAALYAGGDLALHGIAKGIGTLKNLHDIKVLPDKVESNAIANANKTFSIGKTPVYDASAPKYNPSEIVQNVKTLSPEKYDGDIMTLGEGLTEPETRLLNVMSNDSRSIPVLKQSFEQKISELGNDIEKAKNDVPDYVYNYQGKGTTNIPIQEDYGGGGKFYRASNNEKWYQELPDNLKGGKISKENAQIIADEIIHNPEYAGELYDNSLVQKIQDYNKLKPFYDETYGNGNIIGVKKSADGSFNVKYGTPAGVIPREISTTTEVAQGLKTTPKVANAATEPMQAVAMQAAEVAPKVDSQFQKIVDEAATTSKTISPTSEKSIGAMNKSETQKLIDNYGYLKEGENPTGDNRIPFMPNKTSDTEAVSKFARTAFESQNVTNEAAQNVEHDVLLGNFSHEIATDKNALANADKIVIEDGVGGATRQWERVVSGSKAVTKDDLALGQRLLVQAGERGDTAGQERLISQLSIEATRAGQNVQSFRLLKKMTPTGRLYYLQKFVDKQNIDLAERLGEKAQKIEIPSELAQQMLSAKTAKDVDNVEKQIIINVAQQTPATWYDRMNAWRYLSMLGNPLTHIRNIIGNAFFQPLRKMSDVIATGLERISGVKIGDRTKAILNPISKQDNALKDFAKKDYLQVDDVLHGGKYDENSSLIREHQKIFESHNKAINTILKPIEGARKFNNGALSAEDTFFSKRAYTDYLSQYMKANHYTPEFLSNGTLGAQRALERGRDYAILQAQRATFNEANKVAAFINRSERALMKQTGLKGAGAKIAYAGVEGLMPFKRTPLNIAKRGLEYSPLNLFKGIGESLTSVRKGTMSATDAIQHLSEGLTGTSLLGLGAFLASQGIFTTQTDSSGKEQAYDAENGVQSYSLNIAGHSYTINWLVPAIMPLSMGANLYDSFANYKPKGILGATTGFLGNVLNAMTGITDPMFSLTMLQGVNNLFSQSFGASITTQFAKTIPNFASQFVPTVGGQIARATEPYRKDTSTSEPISKFFGINKSIAKIPGLANTLPNKLDTWGKPISNGNIGQRIATNFLSPGYIGSQRNTAADNEIQRLRTSLGDTSVIPPSAPTSIKGSDGKTYYLAPKESVQYKQTMGQTTFVALSKLINDPTYKSLPDVQLGNTNDKQAMVAKVYSNAQEKAKQEFFKSRGISYATVKAKETGTQKYQGRLGKNLYSQISDWTK